MTKKKSNRARQMLRWSKRSTRPVTLATSPNQDEQDSYRDQVLLTMLRTPPKPRRVRI